MRPSWTSRAQRPRVALMVTLVLSVTRGPIASAAGAGADSAGASTTCPAGDGAPEKRARTVFDQAVQLEASEPERALVLYQCAASIADRAVIELRIGVVAERLQRDDVAIAAFDRYLSLAGKAAPDADKMQQHVAELRAARDKREKLAADAKSSSTAPSGNATAPGEPSSPPPEEERSRAPLYLGWSLVAGAGVLGAVGIGMLVDAHAKSDDVQALPMGTSWSSDQARGTYDGAKRSQTIGIVCLAIVPALLIAGGILVGTSASRRAATAALRGDALRSGVSF